jgi:uncharacterized iron-regulated protein
MQMIKTGRRVLAGVLIGAACLAGCASSGVALEAPDEVGALRIIDAERALVLSVEELASAVIGHDVVFFGEFHGDSLIHATQLRLLEEIAEMTDRPVVVAMEMFERDVQQVVDRYLDGQTDEDAFLAASRPWRNYASDYRPLVEMARRHGWPVIAGNIPREVASRIAREGLAALSGDDLAERGLIAEDHYCPEDAYFERFAQEMQRHPVPGADEEAMAQMTRRYYESQCAKDEAMAESVARAAAEGALVIHFNGSFHSDYRLGIVPRLLRRQPGADVVVISPVPSRYIIDRDTEANLQRGDFLLLLPDTSRN